MEEMSNKEKQIREILKKSFPQYANICLKIIPKVSEHIDVSPIKNFTFNRAQNHIHKKLEQQKAEKGYVRAIIVKGRQQGCTTYVSGRYFWQVSHRFGCKVFILTHHSDATNNVFDMVNRFYQNCYPAFKPIATTFNAKELHFGDLDSGYKVGTAGSKTVGRSSTIQLFHGSEVAYWENSQDLLGGVMQAVPFRGKNTEVILESTANGVSNYFHDQWKIAEKGDDTDFIPIFIPWFWQDEYRVPVDKDFEPTPEEKELKIIYGIDNSQINFRRYQIKQFSAKGANGDSLFCQEYPCNSNEAFQASDTNSFINSNTVMLARKCKAIADGHVVIGIDPARGEDRTSIAIRQGRVTHQIISCQTKDTMQVVSMAIELIKKWNPIKIFIDVIGIGAGIVDRLKELGHGDIVVGINAASKALDRQKYVNKRAEMWGEMRQWLEDIPCQIPDIDSLHSDLCSVGIHHMTSNGALQMEKKDIIKSRHRSPDEGDALALTFAQPVYSFGSNRDKITEQFTASLVNKVQNFESLKRKYKSSI